MWNDRSVTSNSANRPSPRRRRTTPAAAPVRLRSARMRLQRGSSSSTSPPGPSSPASHTSVGSRPSNVQAAGLAATTAPSAEEKRTPSDVLSKSTLGRGSTDCSGVLHGHFGETTQGRPAIGGWSIGGWSIGGWSIGGWSPAGCARRAPGAPGRRGIVPRGRARQPRWCSGHDLAGPVGGQAVHDEDADAHVGDRPHRVVRHPPHRAHGSDDTGDHADPPADL